jgi:hypothetical protein
MKYAGWILIVLLLILHQDVWYWDDPTLVFGFVPIGLLYHVGISFFAGMAWLLVVRFDWPERLDQDETSGGGPTQ